MSLGGTDARQIASGNWLELWEFMTGRRQRPDLAHVWKPRLGLETERLHAYWHGFQTGSFASEVPDLPMTTAACFDVAPWAHATFDYWLIEQDISLELKHTNERNDLRGAATYYMAQLQWQMFVSNTDSLRFSIIRGNNEPEWGVVNRDPAYIGQLLEQAKQFWWHVVEDVMPAGIDPAVPAALAKAANGVTLNGLRPYDMRLNNEWVATAADYIVQKKAADSFKGTNDKLRGMIPADAETVTGGGLTFKRDARGAYRVTIHD